ncbi:MAG: type II toxin-antitoxin system RelB/DinJ family antitoxin [Patescibacteria group bacterium]
MINFKTDNKTKKQAQKIAQEMGLSLSSVLNVMLLNFIKRKTLFISLNHEEPTDYLLDLLRESENEIKKNALSPKFRKSKEAIKWLNK